MQASDMHVIRYLLFLTYYAVRIATIGDILRERHSAAEYVTKLPENNETFRYPVALKSSYRNYFAW